MWTETTPANSRVFMFSLGNAANRRIRPSTSDRPLDRSSARSRCNRYAQAADAGWSGSALRGEISVQIYANEAPRPAGVNYE